MRVYRDCNPGTAVMAQTLQVMIDDLTTTNRSFLQLRRTGPFLHSLDTSGCVIVPTGICIEYYEFTNKVTLTPSPGGYNLSVTNCCRNALIINVPKPLTRDYHWNTSIPPNDSIGNNSPEFLAPPPVLLCLNQPLNDTIHVQDLDGDSLSYELCDIYRTDRGQVKPVPFVSPFSKNYPMPSAPPFSIDSQTGKLNGTPNQVGHYVVGICATDWRNGVPMSTVRLDYEFNVTPCYSITSDMLTQAEDSTSICAGFKMHFINQSQHSSDFYWDFGDTTTLGDTSRQINPTYSYKSPGTYRVMLIASPGDKCADTAFSIFEVNETINPDFEMVAQSCYSSQPVNINIQGNYPNTSSFEWHFGSQADVPMYPQKHPPAISWNSPGTYPVSLLVRNGKCLWEYHDTIHVVGPKADILTQAEDSTMFCSGLNLNFFSQSINASSYYWDFGDPYSQNDTSTLPNPSYKYVKAGFYEVMLVANPGDTCSDTATAIFEVKGLVNPKINTQSHYCFSEQPIQFNPIDTIPIMANVIWDFGLLASVSTSNSTVPPKVSWSKGGSYPVSFTVNYGKCQFIYRDTIRLMDKITSDMITLPEDNQMNCGGLTLRFISESKGAHSLKWNFGDLSTLSDTSTKDTAYYTFPKEGFYLVSLVASQKSGCTDSTSYLFEVFPELDPQISTTGQFCFEAQEVNLEAAGKYPRGTSFRWDLGPTASLPVVKNPSAPRISWTDPGSHIVTLTVSKGSCTASTSDTIDIPQWSVPVNAGSDTTIKYRQLVNLSGSAADQHYWYSDRVVGISNPFGQSTTASIPFSNDTVLFYLRVTDANGCQGIDTLKVYVLADPAGGGYNVLTPNGDGRNDRLDLSEYMLGRNCDFTILNRWGSEVYHADKYLNDWAGTDNRGRPLPDGTYYYILFCDRTVTAKGPITIINSEQK